MAVLPAIDLEAEGSASAHDGDPLLYSVFHSSPLFHSELDYKILSIGSTNQHPTERHI